MDSATKKSFVGLESAYEFFLQNCTQQREAATAILGILREPTANSTLRMCYSGCGDKQLITALVDALAERGRVEITFVDHHADWLQSAAEIAQRRLGDKPRAVATYRMLAGSQFDVVIAHHTLYYVPDLRDAVSDVASLLAPNGLFIAALAANENEVKACVRKVFEQEGRRIPYWLEDDVARALSGKGFEWRAQNVRSTLDCHDTVHARRSLTMFLTGDLFRGEPTEAALGVWSAHSREGRLHIPMVDKFFVAHTADAPAR